MSDASAVDLIIFDLGRVLIDFDFKKVIRRLTPYTSKNEKEIRHFFERTPLWDAFERGQLNPREFFDALKKALPLRGLHFEAFEPIWNDIFTEKHDTVAVLRQLRGRYRLALISNVNAMHWEYVQARHPFLAWFDYPVASHLVGRRKPETDIFRLTLHQTGVAPQRALFFDDVIDHVFAARSMGIQAHLFHNARQLLGVLNGALETAASEQGSEWAN